MTSTQAPGDDLRHPLANSPTRQGFPVMEPAQEKVFREAIDRLDEAGIPFLVAGAFACHAHSGAWRNTKDLDLFLRREDVRTALDALAAADFETVMRDPLWIAKAWKKEYLIDLIFALGNRMMEVDESWIERASRVAFCDREVRLLSVEDLIASKMYIAARDRFDGADVVHLLVSRQGRVEWDRIETLMGESRELILWHLLLFDFVYPGHRDWLPVKLMERLIDEARDGWNRPPGERRCRGPLLDPIAFSIDIVSWGYPDPRPEGESA